MYRFRTILVSNFSLVDSICDAIHKKARSLLDRSLVWDIQIMALIAQGKPVDAVYVGLKALREFGIKIRFNTPQIFLIISLLKTKLLIKNRSNISQISKTMKSPKHQAVSRLLMRISTAAYVSGSKAFVPIVLKSIGLFVKFGYSPHATYALTAFGGFLGVIGDHSSAHKFGQLALTFIDREDTIPNAARTVYVTTAFIGIYNVPYKDLLPNLLKHYEVGVETGDLEYAAFNIYCYCYLRFMSGDKLCKVNALMAKYADNVKKQDIVANFFMLYHQLIQNLLGESNDPLILTGSACDEKIIKRHLEEHRNEVALFDFYTKKTMLGYFFYEYSLAINSAESAMQYIQAAKTKHDMPVAVFYQALTICALKKFNIGIVKQRLWKILKRNISKIKKWSKFSPSTFLHKYLLLSAELYFIKGDNVKAEKMYHKSVCLAKNAGIKFEMAIAFELLAIFYKHRGYENIYQHYMRMAFSTFREWGAIAKCRVMEDKFSDAFEFDSSNIYFQTNKKIKTNHTTSSFQSTTTQQTDLKNIDLLSVLKASQFISSEMNIDSLSKKLLKIIIENAGAQKGALIFLEEDTRIVESVYFIDESGQVFFEEKQENIIVFPESVINYVTRTKKYVVIDDAANDNTVYTNDPYIKKHKTKSLLCLPLIRNDATIAVLYLENSVASNAFTEERIKVLELLSAQAAISIENAKLYTIKIEKKLAESKAAAKSQFLAHMSHEIRTPINTILGYSELIKESGDTSNGDYIKNIISSGELLISLVDDVLDFSRIEKGLISLNLKPMSLNTIFTELEPQYKRRCNEKRLALKVNIDEFLSNRIVVSDEVRIRQVLLNLLNNAIKYTETGFVKLTGEAINIRAKSVDVICKVEDSGIGIEDTNIIFGDFEQIKNEKINIGGFGLGLAIVKKLVEALGGSIVVESKLGEGSKFTIKLTNLKIVSEGHGNDNNDLVETIRFQEANLLVADDNKSNLELVKDYFKDQPIHIYTAENGLRAMEIIRKTDFAAILLDLKMPIINGTDLTRYLKTDNRYSSIPVIIITANVTDEARKELIDRKCNDYLLKPVRKRTLFNTLKHYISYEVINVNWNIEENTSEIPVLSIPNYLEANKVKDISEELKFLKEKKWINLERTMIISEIISFADDVRTIGDKYGFDSLKNWGAILNQSASKFDVAKTELIFSQFDEIIHLLENHSI